MRKENVRKRIQKELKRLREDKELKRLREREKGNMKGIKMELIQMRVSGMWDPLGT
jgi:hypothetical protein